MKITQLKFNNWRCFNGEEIISFSTDRFKPISTVYGTNGSGKTTILNSVLWSLWNILTDDFEQETRLVSDSHLASVGLGKNATGSVEIKFEHAGSKYEVVRTYTEKNLGNGNRSPVESRMMVLEIDENGEQHPWLDEDGFDRIDKMFPRRLAKYFFFNGESFVSDVTNQSGQKDFGRAVRHVLGLTIYERALQHSKTAKEDLEKSIAVLDNDKELEKEIVEQGKLEGNIEILKKAVEEVEENIEKTESEIVRIDEELKNYEMIKEWIAKRIDLENEIGEINNKIKIEGDILMDLIAKDNACMFLQRHAQEVIDIGDSHRVQKHIPASFKESFIHDLLKSGFCICGEPLVSGEPRYDKVSLRLSEGALTDTEEEWTNLVNSLKGYRIRRNEFEIQFRQINARRNELRSKKDKKENDASYFSGQIEKSGKNIEEIGELEGKRTSKKQLLNNLFIKKGEDSNQLKLLEANLKKCQAKIDKIEPKNKQSQLERKRQQLLLVARNKIENELASRKDALRIKIEQSITNIFMQLSATNFFARLSEEFVLTMHRRTELGEPIEAALGKGDKQLSYYSFVAALSEFNFSTSESKSSTYESFPIMIDAPFSQLDGDQQKRVISLIPKLTHQLILMMLETSNVVMKTPDILNLTPKVCVSVLYTANAAIPEKSIFLPGSSDPIPYVVRTQEKAHFSKLVQVK